MTQEKRKRGRPPGSGKKVKIIGEPSNMTITLPPPTQDGEIVEIEVSKQTTIVTKRADEPAKYQTAPMSNLAIENRKKKLGLKD
jgi:hypothetical protein